MQFREIAIGYPQDEVRQMATPMPEETSREKAESVVKLASPERERGILT
jgi:hypothetical protein